MPRSLPGLLVAAALLPLAVPGRGAAQGLPPSPVPVPAAPPTNIPPPPPFPGPSPPAPVATTPSPTVPGTIPVPVPTWQPQGPLPPPPPPLFYDDRTRPPGAAAGPCGPCAPPGWFAALEIDLVSAQFHNRLVAPVTVGGLTQQVAVPGATLDWTGSPRLELGYRLADGAGALLVGWRGLFTSGTGTLHNFDPLGDAALKSRLNLNSVDLLYRSCPIVLAPCWSLTWDAGARIGVVYYDSRAQGGIAEERVTDHFVGAGPRVGAELARQLDIVPGLALFGRLETGAMFGRINQSYALTENTGAGLIGGAFTRGHGETVPFLTFMTGLSYVPQVQGNWMRFGFGYLFEEWWGLGDLHGLASRGDLTIQGLFFRGEFTF